MEQGPAIKKKGSSLDTLKFNISTMFCVIYDNTKIFNYHNSLDCFKLALTNEEKSGCGSKGLDLSSG